MNLFSKFESIRNTVQALQKGNITPVGITTDKLHSATEGDIDGRRILLAGTNNYLGLTFHPDVIASAKQALDGFGTGSTGSRMASGTYSGHIALEEELADFFGMHHAIVFTTGYQANLGMISTLAGSDDHVFIDADSHASIYDGVKLSGANFYRFKHNSPEDLAKKLNRVENKAQCLIVLEGLYSMVGDCAPLKEFAAVKKEHGGYILLDEAHSLGVLGPEGRGLAAKEGVLDEMDFIVGTFSKSLGCVGGYCVSNLPELNWARNAIRSYMFTASSAPSVIATARAALKVMRKNNKLRETLWRHAYRLHNALQSMGFQVGSEASPVIATLMSSPEQAAEAWHVLLDQGVYVNLVVPPATPSTLSLLRCSLSAAHSDEQIDQIIAAYNVVAKQVCGFNDLPSLQSDGGQWQQGQAT